MAYERVIFDLDGTLIDSASDLHRCINLVLGEVGAAPLELAQVRSFVGNGVPTLVERSAGAAGVPFSATLVARFQEIYGADPVVLTTPYPGVPETLDALRHARISMSIATNKPEAPTRSILERFGWSGFFDIVVGGDTLPVRKPDPAPLEAAFGTRERADVLFVGDSEVDAETAQNARVDFALYTEGIRSSPIEALAHKFAFSDFAQLPGLVRGVRPETPGGLLVEDQPE